MATHRGATDSGVRFVSDELCLAKHLLNVTDYNNEQVEIVCNAPKGHDGMHTSNSGDITTLKWPQKLSPEELVRKLGDGTSGA